MANSELENVINNFYEALDAKEEKTLRRLAVAHQRTIDKLSAQLEKITKRIELDQKLGLDSGTYILQQQRLAAFITQANEYFQEFGTDVGVELTQAQKDAVSLAEDFVPDSITAINGPPPTGFTFAKLPEGAIQQFVGSLADGSPVRSLTESFGADAAKILNNLLLTGIATGQNPLTVARQMAAAVPDMLRHKANTIARTEMMRANRGANTKLFKANKDVVKGWKWFSSLDRRTCPVCWAMHGKTFPPGEIMATHPNCRCTQIPITKTWKELGFDVPEIAQPISLTEDGEYFFKKLDVSDQIHVLGKSGHTLWSNGVAKLEDFVQDTYSPQWGFGRTTRSIKDMVGPSKVKPLTQGRVPKGTKLNPMQSNVPEKFNPLELAEKSADDALKLGKLTQDQYDVIQNGIANGTFKKADEIEDMISQFYDDAVNNLYASMDEAKLVGAMDDAAIQSLKDYAANNSLTQTEFKKLQDSIEKSIQTKKDIVKAEYDTAVKELEDLLQQAKTLGIENKGDIQLVEDLFKQGKFQTKSDLQTAIANVNADIKFNSPYTHLQARLDAAKNLGNPNLTAQANAIDVSSLTVQEAKDQIQVWEQLISDHTPLNNWTTAYHPSTQNLTKLYNDGKITQTEYINLLNDANTGLYDSISWKKTVDDLEQKLSTKVTKSSQQLLSELNSTGYTQGQKYQISQDYKWKKINKEDLQSLIDKAPKPAKAPSSIPQGANPVTNKKLPYKKHLKEMDDLLKNGVIDQAQYDDIIAKYQSGVWKNKQVEQYLQNIKIAGGQQGGSVYVPGSIDVKSYYWDSQGWINNRGRSFNRFYNMTTAEKDALQNYTGSSYTSINRYLRKGTSGYNDQYVKQLIKDMDSYLDRSRLTEDVKLFRSMSVDRNTAWANPKIGDVLVDKGYSSFTVKDGGLHGWGTTSDCDRAGLRIVAVARKGVQAAWLKPISLHNHEDEMLIHREAKFVVTDVLEVPSSTPGCASKYTIYGEFIP